MTDETITTKIRKDSKAKLREIAKSTGEAILDVLDKLIDREHERLKRKGVIEKGSDE
jgi:hypothetical protein